MSVETGDGEESNPSKSMAGGDSGESSGVGDGSDKGSSVFGCLTGWLVGGG